MKSENYKNRIIVENGKIKTIYSEEIENNGGWMDIEESRRLMIEEFNMFEKDVMNDNQNNVGQN